MNKAPGSPKAPGSSKAPRLPQLSEKLDASDPYLRGRRDALHELRASGGVTRSVLALQVLYCLPDSFVIAYEQLFDAATSGAVGAVSGKGVEQDKGSGRATGKKNGIVLGSETGLQAAGGGKRWRTPTDFLGSDRALATKTAVDKELHDLAATILRELQSSKKSSGGDDQSFPGRRSSAVGTTRKCKGSGCGRFLAPGHKFCPQCGTPTR